MAICNTVACTPAVSTPLTSEPTAPAAGAPKGLAIVGASATAGWGVVVPVLEPREGHRYHHVTLADAIYAIDPTLPAATTPSGSPGFFRTTNTGRAAIVDAAIATNPEAISAVDFLFWYGYGSKGSQGTATDAQRRAADFEEGLRQADRLAAIGVPVIIGNLPDVNDDLQARPFSFLSRRQVPQPDCIATLNERVKAWAATKPNVHLLDLHGLVKQMKAGKSVPAGGTQWGPDPRMMQKDRLHPSPEGLLALGAATAAELQRALGQPITITNKAHARKALRRKDRLRPDA